MNDKREIIQLFYAAQFYFNESKNLFNTINNNLLNMKLKDWDIEFKNNIEKYKESNFFYFSCHLDSCAIRLYAIEENIKGKSNRWRIYNSDIYVTNSKIDKKIISENEIKTNLNNNLKEIIHFILRHGTAHDEDLIEKKRIKSQKILKEKYKDLNHNIIYNNLDYILGKIRNEVL